MEKDLELEEVLDSVQVPKKNSAKNVSKKTSKPLPKKMIYSIWDTSKSLDLMESFSSLKKAWMKLESMPGGSGLTYQKFRSSWSIARLTYLRYGGGLNGFVFSTGKTAKLITTVLS